MIFGIPMAKRAQEARCTAAVKLPDGSIRYFDWKGRTLRGIHRKARAKYLEEFGPKTTVRFGMGIYVTV